MNRMSSHRTSDSGGHEVASQPARRATAFGVSMDAPSMNPEGALRARLLAARAGRGMKDAHEPGSGWEGGVSKTGAAGVERVAVSSGELGETEERLDALPLAPARDARAQGAARLSWGGARPRPLRSDSHDAKEGAPLALDYRGGLVFGLSKLLDQRRHERSVRFEAGRDVELEPGGGGHRPVLAKEVGGLLRHEGLSADPVRVGPESWPLLAPPNEPGGDG